MCMDAGAAADEEQGPEAARKGYSRGGLGDPFRDDADREGRHLQFFAYAL